MMSQDTAAQESAEAPKTDAKAAPRTESDTPRAPTPAPGENLETETEKATALRTGALMSALCLAVFLAALDITIVTTALPTISDHFHSASGYVWVGSAFLLGAAASTPNWGKFSDVWGRKAVLLMAVAIFSLGSALCGAAVSLAMLIAGRAVQGAGAGGLLSMSNIIVADLFSQRERGKYYGIIGMVWAFAASLGPVVGGAFTNNVSWRWCFYLNLPISGVAFAIIAFALRIHNPRTPLIAGINAVDWLGSLTIAGGTLMLLIGLQLGGSFYSWDSATVICLIVFAALTLALFMGVELRVARYPAIPLRLFANRSNVACMLVVFFHGIVFTQCAYFIPVYFQAVLGATPLLSGVWLLPFTLSISLLSIAAGIYIKVTGRHIDCIRLGFVLTVIGSGLLYILPRTRSWARIVVFQIIVGAGLGANFQPPLIALQSNVPAQNNASVTASFSLMRNVASAVAVVIGSVAFGSKMSGQQEELYGVLGNDALVDRLSGDKAQANLFVIDALAGEQKTVVRDAFFEAVRVIWIETVCFSAAGLLACLLIRNKKLETVHEEVKTGLEGEEARRRAAEDLRKKENNESEV